MCALIAVGESAIVIGWGTSRINIAKGQAMHNIEDVLQVLPVKGLQRYFEPKYDKGEVEKIKIKFASKKKT